MRTSSYIYLGIQRLSAAPSSWVNGSRWFPNEQIRDTNQRQIGFRRKNITSRYRTARPPGWTIGREQRTMPSVSIGGTHQTGNILQLTAVPSISSAVAGNVPTYPVVQVQWRQRQCSMDGRDELRASCQPVSLKTSNFLLERARKRGKVISIYLDEQGTKL